MVSKKENLQHLVDINQFRGNYSYSISALSDTLTILKKDFGEFPEVSTLNLNDGFYACHVQAPTGGMIPDKDRIHPSELPDSALYHNGIITPRGVAYMQDKLQTTETFDTKLLHGMIDRYGFECLSDIEGGFACLYIKQNNIYIFRTKHLKLHFSSDMITSERAEGTKMINADTIYKVSVQDKLSLEPIDTFKTKRYNYIIAGEM